MTDATAGVVDYWSPQRRADPHLDDPADHLYALGVILFECLTRALPHECGGPTPMLADRGAAQPMAPAKVLDLVCRMLAPTAADRPTAE